MSFLVSRRSLCHAPANFQTAPVTIGAAFSAHHIHMLVICIPAVKSALIIFDSRYHRSLCQTNAVMDYASGRAYANANDFSKAGKTC